jgi:hypothetical protein
MKDLTIKEIAAKYANIEDKIPLVWPTYEDSARELAQDIYKEWDIRDAELIRVIALMSLYTNSTGTKLLNHINQQYAYAGLYPSRMRVLNIYDGL